MSSAGVVSLVCSSLYTTKANDRSRGGVGFETIVGAHEYSQRTVAERERFIPIVRDNDLPRGRRLPRYLGSARYIDLSGDDWRAEPMLDLVPLIRRHVQSST